MTVIPMPARRRAAVRPMAERPLPLSVPQWPPLGSVVIRPPRRRRRVLADPSSLTLILAFAALAGTWCGAVLYVWTH